MTTTPTALRHSVDLAAVYIVWQRELIRFLRTKTRIVTGLVQPILFLFVLGVGLTPLVGTAGNLDFTKFVFPGVVAMSVLTTAIFSAVSIVWDREFGFLREMLVAPVRRGAIITGKALGGTTVATIQGAIMLVFAPAVGLRITPRLVLEVLAASALMAFGLTGFGIFVASRVARMESFQMVMQFLLFPMLFLSGALFPLEGLPGWLAFLTRLNPVTYAVDPIRRVVLAGQGLAPEAFSRFGSGVSLFGRTLDIGWELAITFAFGATFLVASIRAFGRLE
ncbi:MAG: transport permease protein [Acidimicrobiia bacterium]|nr:MAG: transport permease protein [Acidimicrobiia bacterium]